MKMEEYKQMNIKKILYEIDGRTEILWLITSDLIDNERRWQVHSFFIRIKFFIRALLFLFLINNVIFITL